MNYNFTNKVEETLSKTIELAKNYSHNYVDVPHYIRVVVFDNNSLFTSIMNKMNIDIKEIKNEIEMYLNSVNKGNNEINFSFDMNKLLNDANSYMNKYI